MTDPLIGSPETAPIDRRKRPGQNSSHRGLIVPLRAIPPPRSSRKSRLDAIVVPASRRPERLEALMDVAAEAGVLLVLLASHLCSVEAAAAIVARTPGCRALIIDIPDNHDHTDLQFETSGMIADLSAGRLSNLSLKRNLGLMLARLLGWRKIVFLDDDLFGISAEHLRKIAGGLEGTQVAGMVARSFPDNSVVCHANRDSGGRQDNFVTGAALGLNCSDLPLEFFPDIYNEDWFFFANRAAAGGVVSVGNVRQEDYQPYADPERAAREEFGDLLAEGLYALFDSSEGVDAATTQYWAHFIGERERFIDGIQTRLLEVESNEGLRAAESMRYSRKQLDLIRPADCVAYLGAWLEDRRAFATATNGLRGVDTLAEALDYLNLPAWREARFGVPHMERVSGRPARVGVNKG
jgi:hypothetical protein